MDEKCYLCKGTFVMGWWCPTCQITRRASQKLERLDDALDDFDRKAFRTVCWFIFIFVVTFGAVIISKRF